MLSKDELLKRTNNGLDVFRHYSPGQWRIGRNFLNPLYEDRKASCNIWLDRRGGCYRLKDFGNDDFSGDCFFYVDRLNGLDCNNSKDFIKILQAITCTDTVASRLSVHEAFFRKPDRYVSPYSRFIYWMDFGNTRTAGQVITGSTEVEQPPSEKFITEGRLPAVTELFDYGEQDERDSGPSCSLAEALQRQDMFINSALAQLGCAVLWKMLRECVMEYRGVFLNLDTLKTNPVKIKTDETKKN
jgi:hypothetical protein